MIKKAWYDLGEPIRVTESHEMKTPSDWRRQSHGNLDEIEKWRNSDLTLATLTSPDHLIGQLGTGRAF